MKTSMNQRGKGHWQHHVAVPESRIAAAEKWLRSRSVRFATRHWLEDGCYVVRLPDGRDAMLLKLTWGGA